MLTAKLFLRLFLVLYLVIATLLLITYFTTPFYGDLTRIGLLPEEMFGWRKPQASISGARLKSVKAPDADVIVIGDSFSQALYWQSELVNNGLAVKTVHWNDFGSICTNVERWLDHSGFDRKGIVIIQSIQSLFDKRMDASLACGDNKQPRADKELTINSPPTEPLLGSGARNGTEKIATGIAQLWNAQLVKNTPDLRAFGSTRDLIVARNVPRGCERFSHAYCTKALFLERDDHRAPLGDATLEKVKKVTARLANYQVVWLVIPDKTTVYFDKDSPFWQQLADNSLGPNLYAPLIAARNVTTDLYYPNDTHFSNTGFMLLGKAVNDYLAAKTNIVERAKNR